MRKVIIALLILSTVSPFTASAEEQWYWVSIPDNPNKGYFTEGPNTIGGTVTRAIYDRTSAGYPVITAVQTPLPENFMEVMEMTEDFENCSEKLDMALDKLREFDSKNEIVYSVKSSVEINEESFSKRVKLLTRIANDAEQCLEEEEQEEEEREEEEVVKKVEANRTDMLKQIQSLLELIIQLKAQLALKNGL